VAGRALLGGILAPPEIGVGEKLLDRLLLLLFGRLPCSPGFCSGTAIS